MRQECDGSATGVRQECDRSAPRLSYGVRQVCARCAQGKRQVCARCEAAGHMRNRNFVINFGIATAVVSVDGWTVVVR
jgi:hypothetical protein